MNTEEQYQQTLDYLYTRLPVFQHIGKAAYKADLNNTIALCNALGNPENGFKSIHIAGTNGKGSTSSLMASVFTVHGYKTGLYTSPHLKDFRERIRIDGEMIPKQYVINFTERVKGLIEEISPSFFEITVAMAFCWFAENKVDMGIIEVGMGGRLDSTNVITPELSIITNIGFDHMDFLGDTLAKIASEKAGIIKHEVPAVIGEWNEETLPVFKQKAMEMEAGLSLAVPAPQNWKDLFALKGNYQEKNLNAVYTALEVLSKKGFKWDATLVEQALKEVKTRSGIRGRWEILKQNPWVVADVAHNDHGLKPVLAQFMSLEHESVHFVLGVVNDKDLTKVLPLFPKDAVYYFCKPNIIRGLDAETLKEKAKAFGLLGQAYSSVEEAKNAAMEKANPEDIVYIGGSTFVVAEALDSED